MNAILLLALYLGAALPQDDGINSSINTLYVVEMSHLDIGFTDPPSTVEQLAYNHIRNALNIADSRANFKFTIESAWQLEQFMERASQNDINRLENRLQQNRFAIAGGYCNPHSGLWGEEEFHRYTTPAFKMAQEFGVSVRTVLLDDVPGYTLAMPRVVAQSDIPYILIGANDFIGAVPDIPLNDRPFWWQGRDGSRALTWLSWGSYAEGFVDWGLVSLPAAEGKIPVRLAEFEAAGYPYDAVLVMRGFDNADVSTGMADLAVQWNATHTNPKIKLATPDEFFDYLIQTYGDVFPTYTGDSAGMWESVTQVTPATNARVRRARAALPGVEALSTLQNAAAGTTFPFEDFREAWRDIMAFDGHTGGGTPWPGIMTLSEANRHNEDYVDLALGAQDAVETLANDAVQGLAPKLVPVGESGLVIFNPLGVAFYDVVEIDFGTPQPADLRLVDPAGGPDAVFRWTQADQSSIAFYDTVPAYGWKRWQITSGGSAPPYPGEQLADQITYAGYQLVLEPTYGTAQQLIELATGTDWLQQPGAHKFGGLERATNQKAFFSIWNPTDPDHVSIWAEDTGPVFRRIRVLDKRGRLLREFRLYEQERRVDLKLDIHESDLPFVPWELHSFHFMVAFPANLTLPTTLQVDGPDGWYTPGVESLPGSALGHFASGTGAILTGANGRWLQMSSPDSSMLDLGEMSEGPSQQVEDDEYGLGWKLRRYATFGQVSNGNLHPIKAEPGMPDRLRYEFRARFGNSTDTPPSRETLQRDLAPPPYAVIDQGTGAANLPAHASYLDITGDVMVTAFKRAANNDGWVLRLRSDSGGQAQVSMILPFSEAFLANLLERPHTQLTVQNGVITVPLTAQGVVTMWLKD